MCMCVCVDGRRSRGVVADVVGSRVDCCISLVVRTLCYGESRCSIVGAAGSHAGDVLGALAGYRS